MQPENLNLKVREHETSVPWEHQHLAQDLYAWCDRFNVAFFENELPPLFLRFDRMHSKRLARYRKDQNSVGARYEICLNVAHLQQPLAGVLGLLLHEMLHQRQRSLGQEGKTANYHNKAFLQEARRIGIPCEQGTICECREVTDPFVSLLEAHGVSVEGWSGVSLGWPGRGSQLKKWSCGCSNIWAWVKIEVSCSRCGQAFQRNGEIFYSK